VLFRGCILRGDRVRKEAQKAQKKNGFQMLPAVPVLSPSFLLGFSLSPNPVARPAGGG